MTELVQSYQKYSKGGKYSGMARLQLKGHIAKMKQSHMDAVTGELDSDIAGLVDELQQLLDSLSDVSYSVTN